MRLILHMGLHKTASTFLQQLLNDHHSALRARGVHYEPQPGYPAHHQAAWAMLAGDMGSLAAMIAAAQATRCHTLIVSSEDLEGLLVNPALACGIAARARDLGVTDLQWHVCLREPGAYFASLFAQLQHHVYADSLALFVEAMKRGAVFMADPHAGGEGTPFWAYCFDHDRYLSDFARMVPGDLVVHDYRDADPFPAWRMLDSLGVLDVLTELPDAAARNARLRDDQVLAGYMDRVADALGDAVTISPELCAAVDQAISASAAHVPVYADAIAQRFAQSHARALDHGRALTGALATTAD